MFNPPVKIKLFGTAEAKGGPFAPAQICWHILGAGIVPIVFG